MEFSIIDGCLFHHDRRTLAKRTLALYERNNIDPLTRACQEWLFFNFLKKHIDIVREATPAT